MKKHAVVTGGAGFIGSHLTDALLARGWDVTVIDDLSTGRKQNVDGRARLKVMDAGSPASLRLVRTEKPDAVFHLAAQVSVPCSLEEPVRDAETNLVTSVKLMDASADAGVKRFVFASSAAVFGTLRVPLPTAEDAPIAPESPYGIAKYACERYGAFFRSGRGLPFVAMRFANVYGPRQRHEGEGGVVAVFASRMLAHRPVQVNGTGTQTRDFLYVSDAVGAMLASLGLPGFSGPYHVGTGEETTIRELFRRMADVTGYRKRPVKGPKDRNAVVRSALDATRIRRDLGWTPRVPLDEGISRTVEWFRTCT